MSRRMRWVPTPTSLIATTIMERLGLKTSAELVQYGREHEVLKKRTEFEKKDLFSCLP